LPQREVRYREAQHHTRATRQRPQAQDRGLRPAIAREAEGEAVLRLLEAQFRNLFEKASQKKGITGENLLGMLERRLDNVIYRMGLGTSHPQCRQIVRHGHIQVNGRKVNIPSYQVKPGDAVEVREASRNNPTILAARDATAHAPVPNWLEVDRETLKGRVIGMPKREELVQIQLNERLIVELYSK